MIRKQSDLDANPTNDESAAHELLALYASDSPNDANRASKPSSKGTDNGEASAQLWLPQILRPRSLAAFLVCFLAIAIALPALYAVSQRRHGLSTADSKYHYLWTYGPTAVFTLIAVFWSRLEYRSKQLMPWKVMKDGIAPASQTILLDYVSPWSMKVLFHAVTKAHYMVALPVTGSFLLTLMIIFSTGLFAVQEVTLETRAPTTILDTFSGSDFNTGTTDRGPWAISYGIQFRNLSYPRGTTQNHLVPRFNVSTKAGDLYNWGNTLEADVDVFSFDLPCERANTEFERRPYPHVGWNMTLSTPSCRNTSDAYDLDGPIFGDGAPGSGLRLRIATCEGNDALRITAVVRTIGTIGQPIQPDINTTIKSTVYVQFTSLICTPIYNISRGKVSYSGYPGNASSVTNVVVPPGAQSSMLDGVSSSDLLTAIFDPVIIEDASFVNLSSDTDWMNDTTVLEHAVRTSFSIIGVQIAKNKLLRPSYTHTEGIVSHIQQRLVVHPLSFGLLEAISILLAGITIGMLLFKSFRTCSKDPGKVGNLAAILVQCQEVCKSLQQLGAASNAQLSDKLRDFSYCTTSERSHQGASLFRICQYNNTLPASSADEKLDASQVTLGNLSKETEVAWWQPFSASIGARGLVVLLPVAVIITVELLYRKSVSSDGITAVPTTNTYLHYTWVYIPAFVMFVVRVVTDSTAFTMQVFQPYSSLRVGGCSADDALLNDRLGKTSLENLLHHIHRRRFSITAISVTTMLAPFLTIAVSGLYTLKTTNVAKDTMIQALNVWTINHETDMSAITQNNNQSLMENLLPGLQV